MCALVTGFQTCALPIYRLHRLVETVERPAPGELVRDAAVDLLAPRGGAADEIVEKGHVGVDEFGIVDGGAPPGVTKFVEPPGDRRTADSRVGKKWLMTCMIEV